MGSYRQPFDYACAQCRHSGSHAVWLVVDVDERPDLAELIRTRQIRSHRCEACGSPVEIDVSLLTGRPRDPQYLLFSPGHATGPQQSGMQLRTSLVLLMADWSGRRPISPDELLTVPFDALDVAVDRDLNTDLRQRAAGDFRAESGRLQRYAAWLDHELGERHRRTLIALLTRLLEAPSLDACRELIEQNPLLLGEDVDVLLAGAGSITAEEYPDGLGMLAHRRLLLRRAREEGLDRAFGTSGPGAPVVRVEGSDQQLGPAVGAALLALGGRPTGGAALRELLEAARIEMTDREERYALEYIHGEPITLAQLFTLALAKEMLAEPRHAADLGEAARLFRELGHIREHSPHSWAEVQHHLGVALMRSGQLGLARAAFERALQIRTMSTDPEGWAATTVGLGGLLFNATPPTDRQSVDQALVLLEAAVRDAPAALPEADRASLWVALAGALFRAGRAERAITILREVVAEPEPPGGLDVWATARTNLGLALARRAEENGGDEDWDASRTCLREALGALDPRRAAPGWLAAAADLGITLFRDPRSPTRVADLEEAITLFQRCVGTARRIGADDEQAGCLNNLGNALMQRTTGDREENVARAVEAYERARTIWTRRTHPQEWALTTARLARAVERGRDNRDDTPARAAELYGQALEVLDPDLDPTMWLRISGSFASLREELGSAPGADATEAALRRRELARFDVTTAPLAWARAQHDLGVSYARLGRATGSRADLEHATEAFRAALGARQADRAPVEWAQTAASLAGVLAELGADDESVGLLQQALATLGPDGPVTEILRVAPTLATAFARRGRWADAVPVFRTALTALDRNFTTGLLRTRREDVLAEFGWLSTSAAFVMAAAGLAGEAVETLERGRTRLLTEALRRDPTGVAHLAEVRPDLYRGFCDAAASLTRAEDASNRLAVERPSDASEERLHGRAEAVVRDELRAARDTFDRARRTLLAAGADPAATVPPGRPLVYLTADTNTSALGFVVTGDQVSVVWGGALGGRIQNLVRGLLDAQTGHQGRLPQVLQHISQALGDDLVGPVADRLRELGVSAVTLIPSGLLGAFPVHALTYAAPHGRSCLLDEFVVAYAPSATVLTGAQAALRARAGTDIVAAVVTDPESGLDCAPAEAAPLVAAATAHVRLAGTSPGDFSSNVATATHLHFAGHASSLPGDPLRSHLRLGPGRELSLLDLLAGTSWPRLRLVVASACQTAVADTTRVPDEFVGLPAGFLAAGVPGFLGTLWPIADFPSALLMSRFYELHLTDGLVAPAALREAQLWLRGLDGRGIARYLSDHAELAAAGPTRLALARRHPERRFFEDPAIWAAHVFIGAS